ncbi:MAG: hypothetical protein AAF585_22735 [Verrucomicrobiota bacterium]
MKHLWIGIMFIFVGAPLLNAIDTPESSPKAEESAQPQVAMNNEALQKLIQSVDPDLKGQLGMWEFEVEGIQLMCMTDEKADRMRIMIPVAKLEDVSKEQLAECMEANFDRALDARYCVNHGVLWGAFIHPLSSLTPRDFFSAVSQVISIRETFGDSYSSGFFQFQGSEDAQEKEAEREMEETPTS